MVGQRQGGWNMHPPIGIIAHALAVGGRHDVLKSSIFQVYGWWHWEVSRVLHGPGLVPSAAQVRLARI